MHGTYIRGGKLDTLPNPHIRCRRRRTEWVEGTQLRGKQYWQAMGLSFLATVMFLLVWWFGA